MSAFMNSVTTMAVHSKEFHGGLLKVCVLLVYVVLVSRKKWPNMKLNSAIKKKRFFRIIRGSHSISIPWQNLQLKVWA